MTKTALKYFNDKLSDVVDYAYMRFWRDFNKTYWVGESVDSGGDLEDGSLISQMILTGTTTGEWTDLLNDRDNILAVLDGAKAILDDSSIAVYFSNGQMIPSDNDKIKRYEMTLNVYQWKKGRI